VGIAFWWHLNLSIMLVYLPFFNTTHVLCCQNSRLLYPIAYALASNTGITGSMPLSQLG